MSGIGEYVLSICIAGIVCAIVKRIAGEKSITGKVVRMVSGVFLAITVCSPIMDFRFRDIRLSLEHYQVSASQIADDGLQMARKEENDIIRDRLEAYILDEARRLDVNIQPQVTMSQEYPFYPISVSISGTISPYARIQLREWITQTFHISEENIQWT